MRPVIAAAMTVRGLRAARSGDRKVTARLDPDVEAGREICGSTPTVAAQLGSDSRRGEKADDVCRTEEVGLRGGEPGAIRRDVHGGPRVHEAPDGSSSRRAACAEVAGPRSAVAADSRLTAADRHRSPDEALTGR